MKGIVDRFENNFVVIEIDGVANDFPKELVDSEVKVNDTVQLIDGIWRKNEEQTKSRHQEMKKMMDSLWED